MSSTKGTWLLPPLGILRNKWIRVFSMRYGVNVQQIRDKTASCRRIVTATHLNFWATDEELFMHTHLTSSLNNTTPNFYTMQPPSSGPNSVRAPMWHNSARHQCDNSVRDLCDTIRYGTYVAQFGTAPMWHNSARHQCDTIRYGTYVPQFGTAPMCHNSGRHQCGTIRQGTNVTQFSR
jgi:hypothetical protein